MGEQHSYGTSCGCLSRRVFIFLVSVVMTVICVIQLVKWVARAHFFDVLFGTTWKPSHEFCTGTQCYEVFSCFGMKDTTEHLREPLASLTGLMVFPVGAYAAHHGFRWQLQALAVYLAMSTIVHAGIVVADGVYLGTCNAYPSNAVFQTLISEVLPPSPLSPAARAKLQNMNTYPVSEVRQLTGGGFSTTAWYFTLAGLWVVFLAYAAREARLLGDLMERGPLGLGLHYGLDQWDELISHDAIRRHKEREMRSQFLDDARAPLAAENADEAMSFGREARLAWRGYGAFPRTPHLAAATDDGDALEEEDL